MSLKTIQKLYKKGFSYFIALSGQVLQSGFHFLLGLILLKIFTPEHFGIFAIVQTIAWLMMRLSDAVAGIPLSVYLPLAKTTEEKQDCEALLTCVNLMMSLIGGVMIFAVFTLWLSDPLLSFSISLFIFSYAVRSYGRGISFARKTAIHATRSDLIYVLASALGLALGYYLDGQLHLNMVFLCLGIGNLFAFAFLSPGVLQVQIFGIFKAKLRDYVPMWKQSAQWNLSGNIATELAANAHSYIIIMLAGAAAFAPIAAASVLFRPLGIIMGSLTVFERPYLTEQIASGNKKAATQTRIIFTSMVLLAWTSMNVIVFCFWDYIYGYLFEGKYDEVQIWHVMIIWSAVFFMRGIQSLPKLEFHARKEFRIGSLAAIYASPVSTIAALLLMLWSGETASLFGIFIGEILLFSILVYHVLQYRKQDI